MKADFVIGAQYGDEGKGKITHYLCKERPYTHVVRFNGGCNAGHTIYHKGQKFVTHHIPAGVFWGIRSIIGNGCVLDPEQFLSELAYLEAGGVQVKDMVFVAENTHVILPRHKEEDAEDFAIGTTKRGNGPAYRAKYERSGMTVKEFAQDNEWIRPYVVNLYEELHRSGKNTYVLCEGAQGFGIDIDWGDYPYVTSSHCTTAGALLNGIPPQAVNEVWGCGKVYETYVGAKQFQGESPILDDIQVAGNEFGATTGRVRQVNWLNLDTLRKSIRINGITHLVLNKVDILREVGSWRTLDGDGHTDHGDEELFTSSIRSTLMNDCPTLEEIFFSDSPERI